jgi:RNA polymerase sigma-70 factor (sigma-E family)
MGVETSAVAMTVADLYRAQRLSLLRLGCFLVADRDVAEELVQDAFAGLQRHWFRLEDPGAATAYLRTAVVNGARNVYRRRSVVRRHSRVAEPDAGPAADFALLLADEHRTVIAALRTLPPRQREVLVLRYWSELTEAEIAETLGISRGTVKSTAARALDALERLLKESS